MTRGYRQRVRRRPQLLLSYPLSPSAHCHFDVDARNTAHVTCFGPDLHHTLLDIGSRRLIHFNATEHPTAEWTLQQLREALPGDLEYKFLLHDRHKTFSVGLDEEVASWGIEVLKSPAHAPTAKGYASHCTSLLRCAMTSFTRHR